MTGRLAVLGVVVVLVAIAGVYVIRETPTLGDDETAVRALVEEFGKKMQNVSLLADRTMVADAMATQYGPLVSPVLLTEWQNNPQQAPGRMTSSPWPDRIEILSMEKRNGAYAVQGEIVEVTNEGGGIGEAQTEALRRPVSITVSETGNKWRITALTLGVYPGDGDWKYSEPDARGIQFLYPERLPTTFISATEAWPPQVALEGGDFSCAEEQERLIGDREYCVVETTEGAAGSIYRTYEYITPQGDFIARAKFTLRFPQCANYDEPQAGACRVEQEAFDIDGLADRIISSIRMQ